MRGLRTATLGWGISLYCLIIGTLMLITPHQFGTRTFLPLQPILPWTGTGLLMAGASLLAALALAPPRWARASAFVIVGFSLLTLAATFLTTRAWTGLVSYLVLSLGALVAAVAIGRGAEDRGGRDLFALTMGVTGALTGILLLAFPGQFQIASYDVARPWFPWHGAAFLGTGCLLLATWWRQPQRTDLIRLAHALAGAAFLAFCVTFAIPNRGLPAFALYGGLGAYLALVPYLVPLLGRISPTRLQTRLTLALMALAAVPLITSTAIITAQEEWQATEIALARQRALAINLATGARDYVQLHQATITALAAELGALTTAEEQRPTLERFDAAFPSILRLATYDGHGAPVASSDGITTSQPARGLQVFEEARRLAGPVVEVRTSRTLGLPVLALGMAIQQAPGRFDGLVIAAVATEDLSARLVANAALDTGEVYLVDSRGHIIAHPNPELARDFVDRAAVPPVAALLASGQTGMLSYQRDDGIRLAGYAPVPELGWGIVVDRPAASVLAGVRAGREIALGVLLVVLGLAFVVSVRLSRHLTVPLTALAQATRLLATGRQTGPMPVSQIEEVASLTRAFGALRDDLARRTSERDGAEARLRLLAEASGALATSLDEGAILAAVVRLVVPVTADWCGTFLLDERGNPGLASFTAAPHLQAAGPTSQIAMEALQQARQTLATRELALLPPPAPAAGPTGLHAAVAVPLLTSDGRRLGALVLARLGDGRPFTAEDQALASELARRIAVAITHSRLYAQEQLARAEAEAAVQVRDRFLTTAAHELKTPLTPLMGQAQLLQRRLERGLIDPAHDRRSIGAIVTQAQRLNRLITSLLDLERLRRGRIALALAPVDLTALARRLAGELEPSLTSHTLRIEAPPELPLILGDELRLEQVLLNLLQNAIKYSPDGGHVSVRIRHGAERIAVEVADQGVGIPEAELERIFTPFYRAASAERGAIPGLGVGLALVHEIVTLHGGSVMVQSTEGAGSTFTFWLPAALPEARAIGEEVQVEQPAAQERKAGRLEGACGPFE